MNRANDRGFRAWGVGMVVVAALLAASVPLQADVRLPAVYGSHMVLQRDRELPFRGWADPGEEVTVAIGDKKAAAKADAEGKWLVTLPAMQVLPEGKTLEVIVSGKNTIKIGDVLVGEVWVCSGQSNMELNLMNSSGAEQEVAAANHPNIRLFQVRKRFSPELLDDLYGAILLSGPAERAAPQWERCTPNTAASFSAVGYFFGRALKQDLKVPVGLINTSWGGTLIEPWTPMEGFQSNPELFKAQLAQIATDRAQAQENARKYLSGVDGGIQNLRASLDDLEAWAKAAKAAAAAGKPLPPRAGIDMTAYNILIGMGAWAGQPNAPAPYNQASPSGLYNGMINPLLPFAIRGAIWYQGESNVMQRDGMLYAYRMMALIDGWRKAWGQGDFPFCYVQLAPWVYRGLPDDELPKVWQAQVAALAIANTGMAVTNDIATIENIHPPDKRNVGERLALWALAKTYGKEDVVYSGPLYKAMKVEGNRIRLEFDHVGGGLVSRDGKPLNCFEIAGVDGKFLPAEAVIDKNSVVVSSKEVAKPVAARFAWSNTAQPNLMNKEGLPASAFRTRRD